MSRRSALAVAVGVGLLAVLVLVTEGTAPTPRTDTASRESGRTATTLPAVTLPALGEGEPVDLAAVRGPAVVSFWASWCPPCRAEMPILQRFFEKYAGRVDVLGIDFTDPQVSAARALVARAGVTYPLVTDLDGSVSGRGAIPRLRGLPYLVLVDAEGTVAYSGYVAIDSLDQLEELVEEHLGVAA